MIMQEKLFLSWVIKFHSCKESGEYKIIAVSTTFSQFVIAVNDTTEVRVQKFQNEIVRRLFFSIL